MCVCVCVCVCVFVYTKRVTRYKSGILGGGGGVAEAVFSGIVIEWYRKHSYVGNGFFIPVAPINAPIFFGYISEQRLEDKGHMLIM